MQKILEKIHAGALDKNARHVDRSANAGKYPGFEAVEQVTQRQRHNPPVRWMPLRKARVVDAVCRGRLSLAEACEQYGLSLEEYLEWHREFQSSGVAGLRLSEIQRRRRAMAMQRA